MENAPRRHLTKSQLLEVYVKKRSKAYQLEGYKHAITISNQYMVERIFAFALDTCVMFLPIALWMLLLLMTFGGMLPIQLYTIVEWGTFALLVISVLGFNAILSTNSGGQTLGKYIYDLKVVGKNHKEASSKQLILREMIGFGIPTFILMIFTNLIGVLAYWLINFIFLLVHPQHISIIDAALGLRIVVLREYSQLEQSIHKEAEEVIEEPIIEEIKEPLPQAPMDSTIDLHIHSNFSDDGQYNVEEIFQMAAKKGLSTISICDHNSIKGNLIAKRMSPLYKIDFVPGVEFDCRFQEHNLRVLGYFIDYNNDIFSHLENEALKRERAASMQRVERFEAFTKLKVDVDALTEKNRFLKISESMIVKQVLQNPSYVDEPILQPYLVEADRNLACRNMCKDFFGINGPCNVSVRPPKIEDILEVIHLTGGVAVLSWAKETLSLGTTYFDDVISKGIEGIEVFTPYYETQEMAQLLKIAKDKKLFVTAGSDFHGDRRPGIRIGQTGCPANAQAIVKNFIDSH